MSQLLSVKQIINTIYNTDHTVSVKEIFNAVFGAGGIDGGGGGGGSIEATFNGSNCDFMPSQTYAESSLFGVIHFDKSKFTSPTIKFQAVFSIDTSGTPDGIFYARLYDVTNAQVITGSEITVDAGVAQGLIFAESGDIAANLATAGAILQVQTKVDADGETWLSVDGQAVVVNPSIVVNT